MCVCVCVSGGRMGECVCVWVCVCVCGRVCVFVCRFCNVWVFGNMYTLP